jgi:hypothetical protein
MSLPENLHTAEGALEFAEVVFRSAKAKFDDRGAVGAASFLLVDLNPETGEPFEDGTKVTVVEGGDQTPEQHAAVVGRNAKKYRAVGILTLFEASIGDVSEDDGPSESEEMNEFLSGFEDTDPDVKVTPAVLATFEHLRFRPRTRVWGAPVLTVEGAKVLGAFEERTNEVQALNHFGRILTFYD